MTLYMCINACRHGARGFELHSKLFQQGSFTLTLMEHVTASTSTHWSGPIWSGRNVCCFKPWLRVKIFFYQHDQRSLESSDTESGWRGHCCETIEYLLDITSMVAEVEFIFNFLYSLNNKKKSFTQWTTVLRLFKWLLSIEATPLMWPKTLPLLLRMHFIYFSLLPKATSLMWP